MKKERAEGTEGAAPAGLLEWLDMPDAGRPSGRLKRSPAPKAPETEEECLGAVMEDGNALEWVPEELKTEDVCLAAVRQNGRALRFVPDALKTPRLCFEAVRQDGGAAVFAPLRPRG